MATNYNGSLSVSGSSSDSIGDSSTFSGNLGVTIVATIDSSGNGTATETIGAGGGYLSYSYNYTASGYGRGGGTSPVNFSTPELMIQHGTFETSPFKSPIPDGGTYFYVVVSGSIDSQGQITEHLTGSLSGVNQEGYNFVGELTGNALLACFVTATNVMTAEGLRPVETLCKGDRPWTASGRLARIGWLGRRQANLRRHPRPHDVMPVRIRAGAFGDGLPLHDLVLSPDHAVLLRGALVPIRHLVNGSSIVQEHCESVTYWHVELDRHDVILAEGLACESYLDTGNRAAFENAGTPVELHPDFARRIWHQHGCAPILTDPADPRLRDLHRQLLARRLLAA